jgi:predicted RNase H-like HicB family nuclease
MDHRIEACREPDGGWVATMPRFPGWIVYAKRRKHAVATARKLYSLLLDEDMCPEGSIPALYPEQTPDSARPELSI